MKIDLKSLVLSKSRFLVDRKSKNHNLGGIRRAITQLIFNAGLAAGAKLSFSSLFLASVDSKTLRKPALNMSRERWHQFKMRQIIYILTSLLLLTSCSQSNTDKEQPTQSKSKKLIGFKTMFLSELGDDKYDNLEKELNKEKIEIEYLNDIIYVSYLDELNACGQYDGNVETTGDTIKLWVELISDEVCTSTSIERITFLIDNPGGKMKTIKK